MVTTVLHGAPRFSALPSGLGASPALKNRFNSIADRDMEAKISADFNPSAPVKLSPMQMLARRPGRFPAGVASFARIPQILAAMGCAVMLCGCGGSPDKVAGPPTTESQSATAAAELQPTEIVSQLLDRVRRGGEDSESGELLTKLAQQELARIGRPFEFPGSPDTTFRIGQAFEVPDTKDSVWVQTFLSEPLQTGEDFQYEVVWTLRRESAGWRVSGFAIDQGEGLEPLEFDFENGDEMAARLAALEQSDQPVNR